MRERKAIGEKASPRIIAVCGKGGVSKTSISAMMTKILMEQGSHRILAIDADSGETVVYGDELTVEDIVWMGNQPSLHGRCQKAGIQATSA